jgi:hypothetical protein
MAFLDKEEVHALYVESKAEGDIWRENYHEFERLADNDLIEGLDENLPEVNDGSLAASLYKLPKRIVSSKLKGRARALDVDDAWITELANMRWENKIIPNANSQAPFHRKWKDATRKAAIYGGQPLITLFVENGSYTGSDFIVPQAQDVTLEAGKVSDYDSDVIFWDIYLTKKQVKDMIEQAKAEQKTDDGYNKWDIQALELIVKTNPQEDRDSRQEPNSKLDKSVKKSGIPFYIAFQRGVEAPFYMCHANASTEAKKDSMNVVREWSNPDPTGDVPVHYLYCYQDFVNPYGIGIVKLAGGTQNVLDYMRQADVLATQIGIRPPILVEGSDSEVDYESMVYAQDAIWRAGPTAKVSRQEMSNNVYEQLPERMSMYKTALNQLIPTGDTSISAGSGDPQYSKTPAGVKFQAASLSIDDEDFKDNLYMTYAAVAKSMINTDFANMQGTDIMKLSDEDRDIMIKSGLEFPVDEEGNPSNELEVIWDEARATFDFEVDPEQDKAQDDEKRLEGLLKITDFLKDPNTQNLIATGQPIMLGNKKIDPGELVAEVISLTTDNEKIIEDISPEDQELMAEQQAMMAQQQGMGVDPAMQGQQAQEEVQEPQADPDEEYMLGLMEQYGVDENTAAFMMTAEESGFEPGEILDAIERHQQVEVTNA